MKFKKLVSAVLGGAMALSLAVPAFATNTVITATYTEPKIEVSVPTTATAVINPFALPTKFYFDPTTNKTCKADTEGAVSFTTPASPIAAQPMFLVNYGETALTVSATATAAVKSGSDLKVAAALPEAEEGKLPAKTMTISVAALAGSKGMGAQWKKLNEDDAKSTMVMDGTMAGLWNKLDWTDSGVKTAVAADKDAAEEELGTLDGAKNDVVQDSGVMAIALLGEATKKATSAWTAKDVVTVTVAYSFEVNAG